MHLCLCSPVSGWCRGCCSSSGREISTPFLCCCLLFWYIFWCCCFLSNSGFLFNPSLFFLLNLFRISVEEQIRHDLPLHVSGDCSPQPEHFSGQHPPHETKSMVSLGVAGDSNIYITHGGISITKCNDWNVDIGRFSNRLMVNSWICCNQQARFTEL